VVISDAMNHPLFKNDQASVKTKLQAIASIPLLFQGKVVGVMNVAFTSSPHHFTEEELHLLTLLSGQAAVAITNARRYKELLEHSEEIARLKNFNEEIVSAMEEGLLLANSDGKIIFVNPRMENMVGDSNLIGKRLGDLVQMEGARSLKKVGCLKRRKPVRCAAYLRSKSGRMLPVQISVTPLEEGDSLFVFTDISRQKRTEEMLQALNDASISLHQAHDVDSVLRAAGEELKKLV
jgi:PAS domain S-box-containing protein